MFSVNSLACLLLLLVCVLAASAFSSSANHESEGMFVLDDGQPDISRVRRDSPLPPPVVAPPPASSASAPSNPRPSIVAVPAAAPLPVERAGGFGGGFGGYGGYGYREGVVGPVYTFVKTNPYAHFKWGVRHVVGKQYAGGYH